jgi:hypothetical protein
MVAFDQSGSVRWSVPNDYPQIATADGGLIGGSGVTYDNNGTTEQRPGGPPRRFNPGLRRYHWALWSNGRQIIEQTAIPLSCA